MPAQLEAFKFAQRTGASQPAMAVALILAGLVSVVAYVYWHLAATYRIGAGTTHFQNGWYVSMGHEQYNNLASDVAGARPGSLLCGYLMVASFGASIALLALRERFVWFPLHPLGYAMAQAWSTQYIWLCFLIGWLAKVALLHYYGARGHRVIVPVAYGLILGDCVVGSAWTFIGIMVGHSIYQPWAW